MSIVEKADRLVFHYYFNDESHSIDSITRNECEKELLYIIKEISETLRLELQIETLPSEEGGFKEVWNFIGKNSAQLTLLVAISTIIISRFPVENKELTQLQIENLKLDNEVKRKELDKLNLEFIQNDEDINHKTLIDSVQLVNKNYKIAWRKSNLYKKLNDYKKVDFIEVQRQKADKPVGNPRSIPRKCFSKFILRSDDLPPIGVDRALIDVISPAIKRGKFKWKGFYNHEIINFQMDDMSFKQQVFKGGMNFSNNFSIEVDMTQDRKINHDGEIKAINTVVHKVLASIEGDRRVEYK